jgi:putative pyruvate formate lyase activating enzyme
MRGSKIMPIISRREILKSVLLASFSGFTNLFGTLSFGSTKKGIYDDFEPGYVKLHKSGALKKRGEKLWGLMEHCELCPRMCGVNKLRGEKGFCQADRQLEISSFHPHFGEEKPLVGTGGSGTIFLSNCGLRCVFCINWEVSHKGEGSETSIEALSQMMLILQGKGCANINFVTPTHYSPHIVLGLDKAAAKGLELPVVYNTCGWERLEILKMLDGIVDVYLPDFKYSDEKNAAKYSSGADNYVGITQQAILEMHRQTGTARPTKRGLINRGLMIRHLVMPNNVSGSKGVIDWIAKNLPNDTYLNLMSQYRPMYKAFEFPEISRKITRNEYAQVIKWALAAGLTNLDIQGYRYF